MGKQRKKPAGKHPAPRRADLRADRLRLLAEVGRRTTAILSPEELFSSAVRIIQETFRYFMVSIFLVDGEDLVARACTMPQFDQYMGHLRLPIGGSGITCWVAANNAPLVVPDVRRDPRYHYELEAERRTRSELAVPIALKGAVIGVLDVQSEKPSAFTELDTFTLETVADQLAVAIENARLYDELRRELAARERASSLLRSLHEAGLAMQRAASPEQVFAAVGDVLKAKGISCALTLLDEAGGAPVRAYASPGAPAEQESPPRGGGGTHFTAGRITAPLLFEDRLLGHLRVFSDTLSPDDVPAMQVFANEIAAAWRKANLVRDLQESLQALQSAQEQLLQSQKMEAVGRLAGGVAHDFNNQLTAIIGYAEMLGADVPEGDPRKTDVKEIVKAARHAADLTRQLLAFSRKQVLRPRLVDLNALLEDMRALLRRLIGEDVRLETCYGAGPLNVVADPTQVQQVIMNLAVNSRDAMPGGGTLTISTGRLPGEGPEGWCLLEVTDTGTGMDPGTLGRLFEPFFTTKEVGKGTGLGLSTVYGIVRQSGGDISCRSAPGQGTTFTIRLPAAAARGEPSAAVAEPGPARGGRETILVVEDEEPVLELVRRTLAAAGYTVSTARSGRDGLAVLGGASRIDMVITDLVLPDGTSGLEIARRVLEEMPATRLLCVSGYSEQLVTGAEALPAGSFLQKPFTPAEILSAVRRVLDAPRGS
jgi:signal transduction histidine kinase/putative methionine-R-sulfoxide reductase with GAF domain